MTVFWLTLYELGVRFRLYTAWKVLIIVAPIVIAWIGWQGAIIGADTYQRLAAYFAPGDQPTLTTANRRAARPSNQQIEILGSLGYRADWNLEWTKHVGPHLAAAYPRWAQQVHLYGERDCGFPRCLYVVVIHDDLPPLFLPKATDIYKLFPDILDEDDVFNIVGHVPHKDRYDLFSYEIRALFDRGHLRYITNDGNTRIPGAAQRHVDGVIAQLDDGFYFLICRYYSGNPRNWFGLWSYSPMFWYRSRPAWADIGELRSVSSDHPLLRVRSPKTECPARFVGADP